MSLQPVMTLAGRTALLAAQGGGDPVELTTIALGSAARAPTGEETALTTPFASGAISSSQMNEPGDQLTIAIEIDGADVVGLVASQTVREVGVFDQLGRLIFYWSTLDGLGALTPATAYALSMVIALGAADAEVIEINDAGPPWEALFETRMQAAEAAATASRASSWRNLFLAQS